MRAATAKNVQGSVGETPQIWLDINRVKASPAPNAACRCVFGKRRSQPAKLFPDLQFCVSISAGAGLLSLHTISEGSGPRRVVFYRASSTDLLFPVPGWTRHQPGEPRLYVLNCPCAVVRS